MLHKPCDLNMAHPTYELSSLIPPEPALSSPRPTHQEPDRSILSRVFKVYLRRIPKDILLALLITTAVSTSLCVFVSKKTRFKNPTTGFIESNRALTQFVAQLLSHLLGAFQVYVLTTLYTVFTSQKLQKCEDVGLDRLRYWSSLVNRSWEVKLPLGLAAKLYFFIY